MPALTIPSPPSATATATATATHPTLPSDPDTSASVSASASASVPPSDTNHTTDIQPGIKQETARSRSPSPDRPPVSPITPTTSAAQLAPIDPSEARKHVLPPPLATFRSQPEPVAISESDNPDAIALRSAISLLQLQKEKSKRDLKILQDLKTAAVADPHAFMRSIREQQRAKPAAAAANPLAATLSDISNPLFTGSGLDSDSGGGTDREQAFGNVRKDSAAMPSTTSERDASARFPTIPEPQNVIRCPPINWHKYHVEGEPLDKMHEEQKKWPGSKEPPRTASGARAPPHSVSAPYSPFTDGYIKPLNTGANQGAKKSSS